jgi:DNA mismatch repair protein MutS2
LIERGSELERELKRKNALLDEKLEAVTKKEMELKEAKERVTVELKMHKQKLRHEYDLAIKEAKEAAKGKDTAAIHRAMNKAKDKLPKEREEKPLKEAVSYTFEVGQHVKYRKQRGTIVSMKSKEAMIEVEGMRLRVKLNELKPAGEQPKKVPKADVKVSRETKSGLKLDLHGKRAHEAEEMLDKFISDALLQGWDEVIVYHGIGTGKLAYAVKEFLKRHPKVKKFEDAPPHMGGYGAKLVTL